MKNRGESIPGCIKNANELFSQPSVYVWVCMFYIYIYIYRRRKLQPTPVFLPGVSQEQAPLVGCHVYGVAQSQT